MTQRCAQVLNGVVENVIIADPAEFDPGDGSTITTSDTAQIGWTYASGAFTPVTPAAIPQTAGLTFLQFMALFTTAEQDSLVNSTDTQVRLFNLMAAGAGSIDLMSVAIVSGVNYLASLGLIASGRVSVILAGVAPA